MSPIQVVSFMLPPSFCIFEERLLRFVGADRVLVARNAQVGTSL